MTSDSLSEFNCFNLSTVLSALAAQVSKTKLLTLFAAQDQVHITDCVPNGAVSNAKTNPTWHWTLLGRTECWSSIEVGEMADAGKVGSSCEGKHYIRHFAWTKIWNCSITVRTNLREHNNKFLSSIGTRQVSKKRATENELGKSMSDRNYKWK